jgi:hypothetical protein
MKKVFIKILSANTCIGLLLLACKKNELTVSPYDYTDGKALFKINYACAYGNNRGVQLKINDVRVSNNITYATPFPGGGLNTGGNNNADYLAIGAGANAVKLSIPKTGSDEDSIVLYETTVKLEGDTYQTLHISDTGSAIKSTLLTDPAEKEDSGFVQYRFINLIPNSTALDLYFGTRKVAGNLGYQQVSDTFKIAAGSSAIWSLRLAGGTSTISGSRYNNNSTTVNQRVFTVYSRGYLGLDSTNSRSAKVSLMYNK